MPPDGIALRVVRPVPGYERHYAVSNDGDVYSLNYRRTGRIGLLAQSTHPEGYKRVKAFRICRESGTAVHRLVALAFIPNPQGLPQVNHLDGNKGHNCASNLEWTDNSGNQKHAFATGLQPSKDGEGHPSHKLKEPQVLEIIESLQQSTYTGQLGELGRAYGVSLHCIFDIKHCRSWVHIPRQA